MASGLAGTRDTIFDWDTASSLQIVGTVCAYYSGVVTAIAIDYRPHILKCQKPRGISVISKLGANYFLFVISQLMASVILRSQFL